ncbi:MAG: hypothetical protein WBE18_00955 [Gammaproteobacteria bacterium]
MQLTLSIIFAVILLFINNFAVANTAPATAMSPPNKPVHYLLVPAVTGNRADSRFQLTFSNSVKEMIVTDSKKMPKGARVLVVTADEMRPAKVLIKVTNAANSEFSATCLLNLSTKRWERAAQQPFEADCGNFPLSGTVDFAAEYTVIGISTPNTKATPASSGKEFRVPTVAVNVLGNNLSADWTVIHTFKDADVSYKVTLYNKGNRPVRERVVNSTTWTFDNLPDNTYKVRVAAQDTKGRKTVPAFTDSTEINITLIPLKPVKSGYYSIIPNYHDGKWDSLHVIGAELATSLTPLPPGAVLISVATKQPKKVQITVTNASPPDSNQPAPTATCTLMMSAKSWSMPDSEKSKPGCGYFSQSGGSAGTLEVPVVIGVSTPK